MFTGIVAAVGKIARREQRDGDLRLWVATAGLDLADVALGDSICVSGCCLTVVERAGAELAFDVSRESLALTTLGHAAPDTAVNLEKALRLSDRLGGHLLSGHVDGMAKVAAIRPDGRSQRWSFSLPHALARYVAGKGSVAVDGVSLTVNGVDGAGFDVNLIPHTVAHTAFSACKVGAAVNIEVDMVARYIERLQATTPARAPNTARAHSGLDLV